jgi:hypothetical protein
MVKLDQHWGNRHTPLTQPKELRAGCVILVARVERGNNRTCV